MSHRRYTLLLLLLLIATPTGAQSLAPEKHAVLYLVFETNDQGMMKLVFHRQVEMAAPLVSKTEAEMAARLAARHMDEELIRIEMEDLEGRIVFRDVVRVPDVVRGEFHGDPRGDGTWLIQSHRVRLPRPTFVVRVPALNQGQLRLQGARQSTITLGDLRSDPPRPLPPGPASIRNFTESGNPANRIDLLIMGDGYTTAEQNKFATDAMSVISDFFNLTPYLEYQSYVNVTSFFTVSNESGADHPQPVCDDGASDPKAPLFVDTRYDATYCSYGIQRLLTVNLTQVFIDAATIPDWDQILMIVNDDMYGGSGGAVTVISLHPLAVEVAQHEYGHTFTGLADEYTTPYPGYPECSDIFGPICEVNVTDETVRSLIKWEPWIPIATPVPTSPGIPGVGLFEGARYMSTGMYRPEEQCLMQVLGADFCAVCTQAYVLMLYQGGWGIPSDGIDPIEPGSESPPPGVVGTSGPVTLSVDLLTPSSGLDVTWLVDGVPQIGETSNVFHFTPPESGTFTVQLEVSDPTPLVHPNMADGHLTSSRSWTVEVGSLTAIFADGFESGDTSAWSSTVP